MAGKALPCRWCGRPVGMWRVKDADGKYIKDVCNKACLAAAEKGPSHPCESCGAPIPADAPERTHCVRCIAGEDRARHAVANGRSAQRRLATYGLMFGNH